MKGLNHMADIKYEIKETVGTLSENNRGWSKELNLISWNDREPKYDIRDWAPEHEKMGKGVTLSVEELKKLREILNEMELQSWRNGKLNSFRDVVKALFYNEIYKEIQKLNSDELVDLDAIAKLLGYTGCVLVDTLTSPKGYRLLFKIPRIPTNVIENLIKHFGQLKNVLEASSEDLDQVEGIGEARAAAIKNGLKRIKEQVNLKKELQ